MTTPKKQTLCPGNYRGWFICWPHAKGLVPLEGTGHIHKRDCWHFYVERRRNACDPKPDFTQEQAEAEGWVCVQLWLSVEKPAHYKQGDLFSDQEQEQTSEQTQEV